MFKAAIVIALWHWNPCSPRHISRNRQWWRGTHRLNPWYRSQGTKIGSRRSAGQKNWRARADNSLLPKSLGTEV